MRPDQNFDDIANKFETNIYGSSKGRLRHELFMYHLHKALDLHSEPLTVLDAGGGTGVMSQAMLVLGHEVTLTDISAETLALAKEKFAENHNVADKITIVQQDILGLPEQQYDLVICHAVLEWLQNPLLVIEKLVALVKPGGHLSLSFFNQDAQRFSNMFYGNFDYVEQGMKVKNQVRLSPNNAQKPQEILAFMAALPLQIIHKAGIRCFHDYLKDKSQQVSHYEQIKRLEMAYGDQHPYLWLGKYFMLIAQKN
ncbi:methyltransferase [Paraglaciecola hydrolytica]|uniref:tRNA 5-carboxymethoxyuridine methyltransferase n=1 Tax=Paraglaciecola hydrolytica TaxID=1799789 RepID=A0A136A6G1_9ALTE|nr:methyltransferase [Paraglaciecola hydrolytica]KXI30822.1 SAM-dependent methyltransferase [Paraglaciecola hydrolytica]